MTLSSRRGQEHHSPVRLFSFLNPWECGRAKFSLRSLLSPLDERLYTGDEGLIPFRQGGSVIFNF
jgi:hypothetical protein